MTPLTKLCVSGMLIGVAAPVFSAEDPDGCSTISSKPLRASADSAQMEIGVSQIYRFERDEDYHRANGTNFFAYVRSDAKSVFTADATCDDDKKSPNRLTFDMEAGADAPIEGDDGSVSSFYGGVNLYMPFNTTHEDGIYDPYSSNTQAFRFSLFAKQLNVNGGNDRLEVAPTFALRLDCGVHKLGLDANCGEVGPDPIGGELRDEISFSAEIGLTPYLYSDDDLYERRRWHAEVEAAFLNHRRPDAFLHEAKLNVGYFHNFDYRNPDINGKDQDDDQMVITELTFTKTLAKLLGEIAGCTPFIDLTLGHENPSSGSDIGSNSYLGLSAYLQCGRLNEGLGGSNRMRRRGIVFP